MSLLPLLAVAYFLHAGILLRTEKAKFWPRLAILLRTYSLFGVFFTSLIKRYGTKNDKYQVCKRKEILQNLSIDPKRFLDEEEINFNFSAT